jgi:hypothetical protein
MSTNEIDAPNESQDQASTQHAILRGALGAVHRIGVVAADISEREWRSPTHLEQRTVERIDMVARAAQICVRSEPEYANGEPTGLMVVEVAEGDYPAFVAGMRGQLDTYERNVRGVVSLSAVSEKIAIAPVVCNLFALRAWGLQNNAPAFTISVDVSSGVYDGLRRMVVVGTDLYPDELLARYKAFLGGSGKALDAVQEELDLCGQRHLNVKSTFAKGGPFARPTLRKRVRFMVGGLMEHELREDDAPGRLFLRDSLGLHKIINVQGRQEFKRMVSLVTALVDPTDVGSDHALNAALDMRGDNGMPRDTIPCQVGAGAQTLWAGCYQRFEEGSVDIVGHL